MYIPQGAVSLDKIEMPQIRLGIQGFPKTGKTYSALTFPNPVVISLDRGLGAHIGRKDVYEVPLYDLAFCQKFNPKHKFMKETIEQWLMKEGSQLTNEQTLVFDGGTGLQNAYHTWIEATENRPVTKSGSFDEFAPWRLKINFFGDICELFKTLKCHVIYICHESEKKEKSGDYLGKIRPLLTGQFVDQLASHFTDWVRQHSAAKPTEIKDTSLKLWGLNKAEYTEMLNSFSGNSIYFWQLEPDDAFDGGTSSLINFPKFIPANFNTFRKYMRKISTTSVV